MVVVVAIDEAVARDLLDNDAKLPPGVHVLLNPGTNPMDFALYPVIHNHRKQVWQTLALYNVNVFITQDPKLVVSIPRSWEKARVVRPTKKRQLQVLVGNLPVPRCLLYRR